MAWVNILEVFYPVGSVYISTVPTSPAGFIGGTWTPISGAAIRGINSETDSVGYIGTDTHTLTIAEMPAHSHTFNTAVNGTKKPYSSNVVSANGYAWTDTFTGPNSTWISSIDKRGNGSGTELIGGDEPHTNVQRSYNCYIWYRTA